MMTPNPPILTQDEITLAQIWNNLSQAQKKFMFVAYESLLGDLITEQRTLLYSTAVSIPLKPYIDAANPKKLWMMRPAGKALVEFAISMGLTPKRIVYLRLKRTERGANVGLMVLLEGTPELAAMVIAGWEIITQEQYRNAYQTINDYFYAMHLPSASPID